MIVLFFAIGIISFIILAEYCLGQKKHIGTYLFWFLVILGSMYAAKGYCQDYVEINYTRACKFVPQGTPNNFINEDGTLSEICLKKVRSTDKKSAHKSLTLHKEKGTEYFQTARDICWYLPKLSDREKAKMIFGTVMAALPGPPQLKIVSATLAALGQYGICCIDEYYEIDYNMNMSRFHFMLVDAFYEHIKEKGW